MKLLINLLELITPYGTLSYLVIVGILLACGFGLPMPEDIILVAGGVLAARGIIDFGYTVLLSMFGVLVGDGTIFILGRIYGKKLKEYKFFRMILSPARDEFVAKAIKRYGDKVIFMARFMPGLRTPVFFATGTYQVPFWKFLVFDGSAALISVPLWVYIGYLFGSNLEKLEIMIRRFQWGIYIVIGSILLLAIGAFIVKRKIKNSQGL